MSALEFVSLNRGHAHLKKSINQLLNELIDESIIPILPLHRHFDIKAIVTIHIAEV